jgi:hypothetical protein
VTRSSYRPEADHGERTHAEMSVEYGLFWL